jgi:hypothetical protein
LLAPWGLLLAAATAVPLLLHLLRRRTGARVEFPALRYLLRAEKEHAREVRLRNLLLMLVRVGIVLALALAIARPLGPLPLAGHAPTAVVLLLDNSLSSSASGRDGPVLAQLVAGARAVLDATRAGDRVWLVTMDAEVASGTRATLASALDAVRALDGAGDAARAWEQAQALLAASGLPETRLVLLTDAQATTWRDASLRTDANAPLALFVPPGTPNPNRHISSLVVDPRVWSPRGAVRATVAAADSVSWRLTFDGRSVARGTLSPGAPLVARVQPADRGWRAGRLELAPDELRGDDSRHLAVYVGEPAAVTLAADAGTFLRGAVAALEQGGRVRRGSDVLIGSATGARPRALLFAPLDPLQVADANRALDRAGIPWAFGARQTGSSPLRGAEIDGAITTAWYALEPRRPGSRAAPSSAGVLRAGATAEQRVDTLVRIGAQPWAIAGDGYVLVASAPDPAATDLPLRAAFLPWLDRVIAERLTAAGGSVTEVTPGARAVGNAGAPGAPAPGAAGSSAAGPGDLRDLRVPAGVDALEAPDGTLHEVRAGDPFRAPWRAGVHFWRRGAARAGALVVNPEPGESELARLDADSLAAQLGAARSYRRAAALPRAVLAAGSRRALDTTFLALALVLLALEPLLARQRRARDPDSVPA